MLLLLSFPRHALPGPCHLAAESRRIRGFISTVIVEKHDEKVMLDSDLAILDGVTTFNLNKAVRRNIDRFPKDFMFQLSTDEAASLRFQIGISKLKGRGGRRYLPYVFTEQGVAMLSSVLRASGRFRST